LNRELKNNIVEMAAIVPRNVSLMNEEQRTIYDRIMLADSVGQDGFFFFFMYQVELGKNPYFDHSRRKTVK
jgi:hypothetical protein